METEKKEAGFIRKKLSVAVAMAVLAIITGCSGVQTRLDDGYQVGDLTRGTVRDIAELCDPADPVRRTAARAAYLAVTGNPFPIPICDMYNVGDPHE